MKFRTEFGKLNSFVLDSLRGLDETIQYQQGAKRADEMQERSDGLAGMQKKLSEMEGSQRSVTNLVILIASFGMLFLTLNLYGQGSIGYDGVLTCTIAMMGSFGPVVALSSLSNNLNQTLASGERVLSILEEKPQVEEVEGEWMPGAQACRNVTADVQSGAGQRKSALVVDGLKRDAASASDGVGVSAKQDVGNGAAGWTFSGADAEHVTFAYDNEVILDNYSLDIPAGRSWGSTGRAVLVNPHFSSC